MNVTNRLTIAATAFIVSACATNPDVGSLTSEQRARLAALEVYQGVPSGRLYDVLGTAKGLSCQRNAYKSQLLTEEEAMQGVRIKAALQGADAVVNVYCQTHSGVDWVNNCWASIVCAGDAIRYSD